MSAIVIALKTWVVDAATQITEGKEPVAEHLPSFTDSPELVSELVHMLSAIQEEHLDSDHALYSACLFALDNSVPQLQFSAENGHRVAIKALEQLMQNLVLVMQKGTQSINFWLPVMSVFYDANVALSQPLQDIYLALAEEESVRIEHDKDDHLQSMRTLIAELGHVTAYELTANFFAQSHAMPPEFFGDLVMDLCGIDEALDSAILCLLHPNPAAREVVVYTLDALMPKLKLTPQSLSRLQMIAAWYPNPLNETIQYWIREQRKKGVVFAQPNPLELLKLQASEIDGGGAQGIFLQFKRDKSLCLAGVLLKNGLGLKDTWTTPNMTKTETSEYFHQVFDDGVMIKFIDLNYLKCMVNHFLAMTLNHHGMPNLQFLELQELLGYTFQPHLIEINELIQTLSVQIEPFTPAVLERALKHTQNWITEKRFAHSWFFEHSELDSLVNRFCRLEAGQMICKMEEALESVVSHIFEPKRADILFHFIWVALWLKTSGKKHEKLWEDCFLVAYAIHTGTPLIDIPIVNAMAVQSIVNSVETMRNRRAHLKIC